MRAETVGSGYRMSSWECPIDPPHHYSVGSGFAQVERAVREHLVTRHNYDGDLVKRTMKRHPVKRRDI